MTISIIYGSYTIPFIVDKYRETESYRQYSIEVDFLITAATPAALETAISSAETELVKDSQRLQVKLGATTHRDYNPSTYSGMMARTSISKPGRDTDTDTCRILSFSCDIQLPASSAADNYRREASWSLSYDPARRASLSFNGVYTGGDSKTAKTNYDAQAATWISSIFSLLSLTQANFEKSSEEINPEDDEGAALSFSMSYHENLAYKRDASWSISYDDSRRVNVNMSGTYVAGNGNSAVENYDALSATWISAIFTAMSVTEASYEKISEQLTVGDDALSPMGFNLVYREVLFNESSAALNTAAIQSAVVSFARSYTTEASVSGVGASYIDITYSCMVDNTDATYGSVTKLDDLWKDVIRPHLLTQANSIWGGGFTVIESENTTLDPSGFSIQSSMRVLISTRTGVISYTETIEISIDQLWNYAKLLDGQDDTYTYWSPGRLITANQNIEIRKLVGFPTGPPLLNNSEVGLPKMFGVIGTGGIFNLDGESLQYTPTTIGQSPDGGTTTKSGYTTTYSRRYTYISKQAERSRGRVPTGPGKRGK